MVWSLPLLFPPSFFSFFVVMLLGMLFSLSLFFQGSLESDHKPSGAFICDGRSLTSSAEISPCTWILIEHMNETYLTRVTTFAGAQCNNKMHVYDAFRSMSNWIWLWKVDGKVDHGIFTFLFLNKRFPSLARGTGMETCITTISHQSTT